MVSIATKCLGKPTASLPTARTTHRAGFLVVLCWCKGLRPSGARGLRAGSAFAPRRWWQRRNAPSEVETIACRKEGGTRYAPRVKSLRLPGRFLPGMRFPVGLGGERLHQLCEKQQLGTG